MNLLEAAILGLVEGITEYLPVSSTGHLILASALMGLNTPGEKQALDAFMIVIQGGAILAVIGLYYERLWQMILGVIGRDANGRRLAINIVVASVPAAILGVLLAGTIKKHLFYPVPVMIALAAGGIVMIAIGRWQRKFFHGDAAYQPRDIHQFVDLEHLTWTRALLIGVIQCLAMWPGMSRSMVTIVGGMIVGMRPRQAAEFSFLLGLPTLGGACLMDALEHGPAMSQTLGPAPIAVGLLVASLSAALAVKWLVAFLTRHGLVAFGWYRICLCLLLALLIWRGVVKISPDAVTAFAPQSTEHLTFARQ